MRSRRTSGSMSGGERRSQGTDCGTGATAKAAGNSDSPFLQPPRSPSTLLRKAERRVSRTFRNPRIPYLSSSASTRHASTHSSRSSSRATLRRRPYAVNFGSTASANKRAGSRVSRPKNSITNIVQPAAMCSRILSMHSGGVPAMPWPR